MGKGPIRRAHLIAPFGVGALSVVRDGTSTICCGLDHWFKSESDGSPIDDESEFRIDEWRLQRQLKVEYFLRPPDFRGLWGKGPTAPNSALTVPFLRFPRWHFCPGCRNLSEVHQSTAGRLSCSVCSLKKRRSTLAQVPFIAICANGHMQDFPWREWVHRTSTPSCKLPMKLTATGGASLAAQRVTCECGVKRTLQSITNASTDSTELADQLNKNKDKYTCS